MSSSLQWEEEFRKKFIDPLRSFQFERVWIHLNKNNIDDLRTVQSEYHYDAIERIRIYQNLKGPGNVRVPSLSFKLRCESGPLEEYNNKVDFEFEFVEGMATFCIPENRFWLECVSTESWPEDVEIHLLVIRSSKESMQRQLKNGIDRVILLPSERVLFMKERKLNVLSCVDDFKKFYPSSWFEV